MGFELVRAHSPEICARQNGPAGLEAVDGHLEKPSVVFLNSKDLSVVVAGEGRRIENDVVKSSTLSGESSEPVEGVALAEIVPLDVELVEAKVLLRPVEIDLREIESGGGCSGSRGGNREKPSIRKGVEDSLAGFNHLAEVGPVVALVDEDALGISGLK